jgi:hypothetical protein
VIDESFLSLHRLLCVRVRGGKGQVKCKVNP